MKHRPPSIKRLLHYERPLVMAGDPQWYGLAKNAWQARQEAVYADMMAGKNSATHSASGKPGEGKTNVNRSSKAK
jgi:hypothetical protein